MRSLLAALLLCIVALPVTDADARSRKAKAAKADNVSLTLLRQLVAQNEKLARQNDKLTEEIADIKLHLRRDGVASAAVEEPAQLGTRNPVLAAPMSLPPVDKTLAGYERHIAKSAKLKDLTPPLAKKVAEILGECSGSSIVSGYRRGARVAGSGRPSLHSLYPSQAADLQGNPSCMYKIMRRGWPGGYSVDYAAVRHIHISLSSNGRERGARFVHHRGGSRYASRHARGSHRYAMRREPYQYNESSQRMHYAVAR